MLSQTALIDKIIAQSNQQNESPSSLPMDPRLKLQHANYKNMSKDELDEIKKLPYCLLVSCQLYLSIGTHLEIIYSVQQLSTVILMPIGMQQSIWYTIYLDCETSNSILARTNPISVLGFTDSDWANCLNTRRSLGGHTYSLCSGIISWQVRKQKNMATSSCKTEYTAAFEVSKEGIWLCTLLNSINYTTTTPMMISCNNNPTINLSEDPTLHDHVKHINIKHHFFCKHIQSNEISLFHL